MFCLHANSQEGRDQLAKLFVECYAGSTIRPEVIASFPVEEAFEVFRQALESDMPEIRLAAAQGINMIVDELEGSLSAIHDLLRWYASGFTGQHYLTRNPRPAEVSAAVKKVLEEARHKLYEREQLQRFDEENLPKEEGAAT